MKEKVIVDVRGTNDGELTFTSENGTYEAQGERIIIEYSETLEDFDEPSNTVITVDGNRVSIVKDGPVKSEMVFQKGLTHASTYVTPFGSFEMKTLTKNLSITKNELIEIRLDYALNFGGEENNCSVEIDVSREK